MKDGKWQKVREIFDSALRRKPEERNESEAFEVFRREMAYNRADEATIQAFQMAYQSSGWRGVAQEQAKQFESKESDQRYFFGGVYNAQAGNKDKAFEYLEKSYQQLYLLSQGLPGGRLAAFGPSTRQPAAANGTLASSSKQIKNKRHS